MSKHAPEFDHLPQNSETVSMLRAMEWSSTVLGDPSTWPESLRLQLNVCFESAFPIAVWWGPELIQFYNDSYRPILGATKHPHAFGRPAKETWPDIWSTIGPMVEQVVHEGIPVRGEDMPLVLERNGYPELCYFTFSYSPIRNIGGKINGMLTVAVETSERERAEQRLAFQLALADRLRPLVDPDEVTAAASEILGRHLNISRVSYCEVDDSKGTFVIRQDWTSDGIPSIASGVRKLDDFGPDMVAELRAGQVMAVADVALDPRTMDYVESYEKIGVRANAAVPLLKGGRFIAILALHSAVPHRWSEQDLTLAQDTVERTWAAVDSAAAQQALQIERDRSRAVLNGMTEGYVLLDEDWMLLEVNDTGARLAQHRRETLLGQNHWQAFPELLNTDLEMLYRRAHSTRLAETMEYHHTDPNGIRRWLDVRVYPMDEGKLAIFFRDITNRKNIEADLFEANRRKDDFLAMLAHELRNPLAPISSAAELLRLGTFDEKRVKKTSEIIGRQVSHMTHLLEDLLDVSRVTRGLVGLEQKPVDLSHVVTEAVEQAAPLIHSRQHRFALHLAPHSTMVLGDKKRLVQVVTNMLTNAAKYTHEGGELALRTTSENKDVLIHVSDNGIGMTPELARHAFDLFAQAERTSDRSSGGLGLGLSLVKSLVELHDGTVTCESAGLGKGSSFTVRLPRLIDSARDKGSDHAQPLHINGSSPLRILVVDDNVDAAFMLGMLLEADGHEVSIEHDSYRGLELAKDLAPRVCVLDIGLPGMNGNELAQNLRACPRTAGAVLIAVTGYGQESDRKKTQEAGFDHHLVKPVDIRQLGAILAAVDTA